MANKKQTEKKLEYLNGEIIWNEDRQKRVRRRLIRGMEYDKGPPVSRIKGRFIPVFSLLLLAAVVTTIFLSEFKGNEIADEDTTSEQINGNGENNTSRLVTEDEDDDNENSNEDNNNQNGNDHASSEPETTTEENQDTQHHDTETNTPETDKSQQDDSNERILTEEEVLHAIKGQITTGLDIKLPKSLPLSEGQHLTAVTDSEATKYEVIFYQHDEPIPINNKLLFSDENPAEVVARLTVQKYDSQAEADEMVAHEVFDAQTGEEIKLGSKLKGYQDAGAGSVWTSFNVGRWALATHSSTQHPDKSEALAKDVISYIQDNMLPIPKPNGFAHLDAENNDNRILWEKDTTVYAIDRVHDPIDALDIAIDFQ